MMRAALMFCLGALLAVPTVALAGDPPAQPGAVAYPDNPSKTPASDAKSGTAPAAAKPACADGTCSDSPGAPAKADTASVDGTKSNPGKVGTPSAAYPDAPVKTPAATATDGTAPKN